MNSEDYIANQIADVTGVTPQQVANSAQRGLGEDSPYTVQEEGSRWTPWETAVDQGQQAIVKHHKIEQEEKVQKEQESRIAMAVAEALAPRVEVGKINDAGRVEGVRLDPETIPESKETIQKNIGLVGKAGRKGVFSELPFDAEDVPKGWEVWQADNGGYWTAPQEQAEEVKADEQSGEVHKPLGMAHGKTPEDDRVVQLRDNTGAVVHESVANPANVTSTIAQALNVAGHVTDATIGIVAPQTALAERKAMTDGKPSADPVNPTRAPEIKPYKIDKRSVFSDILELTGHEEHPKGYVSPMTQLPNGNIGVAQANRDGMAYPYMFHVEGKGWEVDRGYGGLIADSLTVGEAGRLVRDTKPITLEQARSNMKVHLAKDIAKVKKNYPKLASDKQGALAMMLYQGGSGLDVTKWTNTNKALKLAIANPSYENWLSVQKHMLNSKWAREQTPERALRVVKLMHPSTPDSLLKKELVAFQNKDNKPKAQPT